MLMEKKIRIGVIGAGHLGKIHIRLLKQIPAFELVGFYDQAEEVRNEVQTALDVKAFASDDELIQAVDAVDVVTPTLFHFHYASKCIKQFKHVFVEKPMTATLDEARLLMNLASEAGIKAQVGHVERFNPAFKSLEKELRDPMFIETHRLAMFNPRGTDVSVVLDLMIHDIDIVLSVVKANIRKISASGVAVVSDTPDIANARLEFDNGCVANITSSRISLKNMRKSRFFQKDAYVSIDFLNKQSEMVSMSEDDGSDPFALAIDLGEGKGRKRIQIDHPKVDESNAIQEELSCFADSILNDQPTAVSFEDGYLCLDTAFRIIEKIDSSLLTSSK